MSTSGAEDDHPELFPETGNTELSPIPTYPGENDDDLLDEDAILGISSTGLGTSGFPNEDYKNNGANKNNKKTGSRVGSVRDDDTPPVLSIPVENDPSKTRNRSGSRDSSSSRGSSDDRPLLAGHTDLRQLKSAGDDQSKLSPQIEAGSTRKAEKFVRPNSNSNSSQTEEKSRPTNAPKLYEFDNQSTEENHLTDETPDIPIKEKSPVPDDPDVSIVLVEERPQKPQPFGPEEYLNAAQKQIGRILNQAGPIFEQQRERKLVDLLVQTLRIEASRRLVSLEKLKAANEFELPAAVSVPPSQIVELVVEHEPEHTLHKMKQLLQVIGRMFGQEVIQPTEPEIRERRLVAGLPSPNMTRFLMGIGQDLVQESTYCDIVHARNLPDVPRNLDAFKQVADQLRPVWLQLRKKNEPYKLTYEKCSLCSFKSESLIVLERHKQVPHYDGRRWCCAFCPEYDTSIDRLKSHYLPEHGVEAVDPVEPPKAPCPCCPADFPFKTTRDVHMRSCKREFTRRNLLEPQLPRDHDVLNLWLWKKPPVERDLAPTPTLIQLFPGSQPTWQQRLFNPGMRVIGVGGQPGQQLRAHGLISFNQQVRAASAAQQFRMQQQMILQQHQHELTAPTSQRLPPLQRRPAMDPMEQRALLGNNVRLGMARPPTIESQLQQKPGVIVCEICDENFDDRSRYLLHLQMYHKQLQSKTVADMQQGAPLACSRCRQRFWTYEGLERHLVMAHGLVTTDLLAKAQKKEDNGRCRICGKQYAFNVLQHLVSDHQLKLCSAEIMYSCDVCSFKCSRYAQLEAHLATKHPTSNSLLSKNALPPPSRPQIQPKLLPQAKPVTNIQLRPTAVRPPSQTVDQSTKQQQKDFRPVHSTFVKSLKRPSGHEASQASGMPFRVSNAPSQGPPPSKRPRIKYTCTPCDLKFEQYSEVIAHWQRTHLRKTVVKLCRFDLCPKHRTQLSQEYDFGFVYPEPTQDSQGDVITLE